MIVTNVKNLKYKGVNFVQISTLGGVHNLFNKDDIKAINTIINHYKENEKKRITY